MGDPKKLEEVKTGGPVAELAPVPENTPDAPIAPQKAPQDELQLKQPEVRTASKKPLAPFLAPKPIDRVSKMKPGEAGGFLMGAGGSRARAKEADYKHKYFQRPVIKGSR